MPQNQNNKNKIRGFSAKSKTEQKAEFAKAEERSHEDPHFEEGKHLNEPEQKEEKQSKNR